MAIIELDDDTVRQIAAGEVVERPASAVKELVENSLDAGATRVDVEIEAGGKERITVRDDGEGMAREEARLAVEEHTTSKIDSADDLTAGVGTLGFRGEALYAIGAVSTMTLTTRPREGGEGGSAAASDDARATDEATRVRVERGEVVDVGPAGRGPGTTVEVTDLFDGMPARQKFLAAAATEFDHANRIVSRYAIANPDVAVSLVHDGREVFATAGGGALEGALLSVYGREVAESMRPVDGDGVTGAVSHPETTRSTRAYVSTFVNGRYVASSDLRGAVVEAYGRQLSPDRYPFAAVFVEVDPDAVDVNVHPRKLEVRFDDAAAVRERVRAAVEDALLEGGLLRSGAPRGRSAPEEVEPRPERAEGSPAAAGSGVEQTEPITSPDCSPSTDSPAASSPSDSPAASSPSDSPSSPDSHSSVASSSSSSSPSTPSSPSDSPTTPSPPSETGPNDARTGSKAGAAPGGGAAEEPSWHPARRVRERGTQTTLDAGRADEPGGYDRLPPLRVLGQLDDTYVVCEADGGLVLVDQHAADERVHYERLAAELAADAGVQALAEPVELELTAREAELFPAFLEALESVGFRAERTGGRTVAVAAVPAVLEGALDAGLLRDVLPELARGGEPESVAAAADAVIADLACHPAVTGHVSLAEGSIRGLLEALDGCENPYACPHGRPTMVEVSAEELADRFERDYPGHAHRRDEA